jgi:hypothetical protein
VRRSFLVSCVLGLALAATVSAAVPTTIPFQSRIVDGSGAPVPAGTVCQFSIFSTAAGGSALWGPETHTVTPVNGVVSVFLGDGDTPDPIDASVFAGGERFLQVQVGAETLTPRFRMTADAYAFRAETVTAGAIDGTALANNAVTSAKIADATITAADLADNSVGSSEIANGAVASIDIAANAINTSHIASDTITAADLAANSVEASEIATGAVGTSEVLDSSLTANDLAANSVGSSEIASAAVDSDEIASLAISTIHLQPNSVDRTNIQEEAGCAYVEASTNVALVTGLATNLVQRDIFIPSNGWVLVTGRALFEWDQISGTATEVFLSVSLSSGVNDNGNLVRFRYPGLATLASAGYRESLVCSQIFQFDTPGQKTFFLVAEADEGTTVTTLDENLSLVYIPTAYGAVTAAQQSDDPEVDFDGASR